MSIVLIEVTVLGACFSIRYENTSELGGVEDLASSFNLCCNQILVLFFR